MDFQLSEEQQMWRQAVHDFVAREVKPKAREVDEKAEFNWDATRKMGALGLLGLSVPEEYGGSGVDPVSAAIAIEELGWGCGSTALAIAAHNGLGCAPLVLFGSEELKRAVSTASCQRQERAGCPGADRARGWLRPERRCNPARPPRGR